MTQQSREPNPMPDTLPTKSVVCLGYNLGNVQVCIFFLSTDYRL